jgi:hypothetical protein
MIKKYVFNINGNVFKLYFDDVHNYEDNVFHKIYLKLNEEIIILTINGIDDFLNLLNNKFPRDKYFDNFTFDEFSEIKKWIEDKLLPANDIRLLKIERIKKKIDGRGSSNY